jgi:hypothetical protein
VTPSMGVRSQSTLRTRESVSSRGRGGDSRASCLSEKDIVVGGVVTTGRSAWVYIAQLPHRCTGAGHLTRRDLVRGLCGVASFESDPSQSEKPTSFRRAPTA